MTESNALKLKQVQEGSVEKSALSGSNDNSSHPAYNDDSDENCNSALLAEERRDYPRLNIPIYFRPAGILARRRTLDVSLGGIKVYSDVLMQPGKRMTTELFIGETESLCCTVEVAWINTLVQENKTDAPAPANYEIGLKFVDMPPGGNKRILHLLKSTS